MATLIWSLFAILGLASKTHNSAQRACSALKTSSAETQTSGDDYDEAKGHYWNAASEDDIPACVSFPTNAEQVSEIVQVLQEYTDVEFAMKSGGHNPNRGFSSVDGGVLISFSKLASTTYNSDSQTADGSCSSSHPRLFQEPRSIAFSSSLNLRQIHFLSFLTRWAHTNSEIVNSRTWEPLG